MQIDFLWVGATRDPLFKSLETRYLSLLQKMARVELRLVPEEKKSDKRQAKAGLRREEKTILENWAGSAYRVVLDEKGKELSSIEFADWLRERMLVSSQKVIFVAGGHYGLTGRLLQKADFCLALGRMTLPHELARVTLLEQVYRAFSIMKGLPYHKE